MTASTHHEVKLKTFEAFAPLTDAFEGMLDPEVPEAAREFVKRTTSAGEKLTTDGRDAAENATAKIEEAAVRSIREFGKIGRALQIALYQDADALFAAVGKLTSAASPTDVLQISSDYVRGRGDAAADRTKAIVDYVGGAASKMWVSAH
jgi:Phasin protein